MCGGTSTARGQIPLYHLGSSVVVQILPAPPGDNLAQQALILRITFSPSSNFPPYSHVLPEAQSSPLCSYVLPERSEGERSLPAIS